MYLYAWCETHFHPGIGCLALLWKAVLFLTTDHSGLNTLHLVAEHVCSPSLVWNSQFYTVKSQHAVVSRSVGPAVGLLPACVVGTTLCLQYSLHIYSFLLDSVLCTVVHRYITKVTYIHRCHTFATPPAWQHMHYQSLPYAANPFLICYSYTVLLESALLATPRSRSPDTRKSRGHRRVVL